ncbi:MAG TPA: hypothetical protein VL346_11060 [Acidobacteriaceae bacterium]|nr:hypothetical protein [Acidobacteriaceae bacterium]
MLSNSDALLLAVPMIGVLVACYFRLDELIGKPRKPRKSMGRTLVGMHDGPVSGRGLDPGYEARRESPCNPGQPEEARELPAARRPRVRAEID